MKTNILMVGGDGSLSFRDASVSLSEDEGELWKLLDRDVEVRTTQADRDALRQGSFTVEYFTPYGGDYQTYYFYFPRGPLEALDDDFRTWVPETRPYYAWVICESTLENPVGFRIRVRPVPPAKVLEADFTGVKFVALEMLGSYWGSMTDRFQGELVYRKPDGKVCKQQVVVESWPAYDGADRDSPKSFSLHRIEFENRLVYPEAFRNRLNFPAWERTPTPGSWDELQKRDPAIGALLAKINWSSMDVSWRWFRCNILDAPRLDFEFVPRIGEDVEGDFDLNRFLNSLAEQGFRVADLGPFLMRCHDPILPRLPDGEYVTILRVAYNSVLGDNWANGMLVRVQDGRVVAVERQSNLNVRVDRLSIPRGRRFVICRERP